MFIKINNMLGKKGQGMTEYIIIVALIAIAAVFIITMFGDTIRNLFQRSTEVLRTGKKAKEKKLSTGELKKAGDKRVLGDFSK
jgi:Flp pilus assembly pilin Flp